MVGLIPQAELRFSDSSGRPLVGGSVGFYVPGTFTPKNTYLENTGTVLNANPVVLDSAGRCIVWGTGLYRMVVKDALGNQIYDQVTGTSTSTEALINPILFPFLSSTSISEAESALNISLALQQVLAQPTTSAALSVLNGVVVVPNIAALRLNADNPPVIYVNGYTGVGDKGGGFFWQNTSDTTSVDNGGTIIVDSNSHRWYRETFGGPYSFYWFGARPDGSDCTAAIDSCIAAANAVGRPVHHPAGRWTVTTLKSAVSLIWLGDGMQSSFLQSSNTAGDIITVNGGWGEFRNAAFTSISARISGSMIKWSTQGLIENCAFDKYAIGIDAIGNTGTIRGCNFSNPTPAIGIGIVVNGYAGGLDIDDLLFFVPSGGAPAAGINIVQCGAVQISNSNIISQGSNLVINPGNGQTVASVFATNTFFDTAQINGMIISSLNGSTGNVTRCHFEGCWFSSANSNGVTIGNPGTGIISNISFTDCMMILNLANGLVVNSGCYDITVTGGLYAANLQNGIEFAGVNGITVTSVKSGSSPGLAGNGFYGVSVGNGCDNYIVAANRVSGNTTGSIQDISTGTNKFVGNNI